jgi:transposase
LRLIVTGPAADGNHVSRRRSKLAPLAERSSPDAYLRAPVLRAIIEQRGARVKLQPPYSHDVNPIEAAWALIEETHPHLRATDARGAPPRRARLTVPRKPL